MQSRVRVPAAMAPTDDTAGAPLAQGEGGKNPFRAGRGLIVVEAVPLTITESGIHLPSGDNPAAPGAVRWVVRHVGEAPILGLHPLTGAVVFHPVSFEAGQVVHINPLHRHAIAERDGCKYSVVSLDSILATDVDPKRNL